MAWEQLSLHCDCPPVVDVWYDVHGDRTPTETIVDAVARAERVDPVDLPPVYDAVAPAALEGVFRGAEEDVEPSGTVLAFSFYDWNVFVRDDGRVRVCDPDGSDRRTLVFE